MNTQGVKDGGCDEELRTIETKWIIVKNVTDKRNLKWIGFYVVKVFTDFLVMIFFLNEFSFF